MVGELYSYGGYPYGAYFQGLLPVPVFVGETISATAIGFATLESQYPETSEFSLCYTPDTPVSKTVGMSGKSAAGVLASRIADHYRVKLWGKVTGAAATAFTLNDGSGVPVRVVALAPL